ncbi:MAG: magnesium/cobalt transporter CorA [Dysgonamonadaceae bacterium]|jgi:magnesium transporter|nr:magnesium/cobalt transporter CorA [Dysgonamonadaceae bacterium]
MPEFKFFYQKEGLVRISRNLEFLKKTPTEQLLWIDLNDVDEEVESQLEDFLKIYIQEEEEMIEIETSSRYIETRDTLVVNANFLLKTYEKSPVSFILKNHILISVRSEDLGSFTETVKKIFTNPENYPTGYHVFLSLLETRIEFDADMIEEITQEITHLSNSIREADEDALMEIKNLQEKTMMFRENIIDKQRAISNMLRSNLVPHDLRSKLTILIKDINSLLEHIRFSFDRLDYLQDTFLGLVNIEQNKIIKIFTIVSVLFMPPTLIASIYGMNFDTMPELHWKWGYLFSVFLMLASACGFFFFFKKKKYI